MKPTLRSDGRWMLALPRKPGESRRYVYAQTKEGVEAKYLKAIGAGAVRVRPGSISEFAVLHFADWQATRMQPDSLRRYDVIWRLQIGPVLGHLLFSELTPDLIQKAIVAAKSGSVQALAKGLCTQIVKLAIIHGWADYRHQVMVSMTRTTPRKSRERRDIGAKANAMLTKIEAAGHWIEGPVWVAMTLGLRKAEVCGLKIGDIDQKKGLLLLRSQRSHRVGDRQRLKHRQAGDSRRIALPGLILERLVSYWRPGSIYVFTDEDSRPISYQHIDRPMEPFQDPENRITFHDLRSAAVSRLVDLGIDDNTIMDIVGHKDRDMIRTYRDQQDDRTRRALEGT